MCMALPMPGPSGMEDPPFCLLTKRHTGHLADPRPTLRDSADGSPNDTKAEDVLLAHAELEAMKKAASRVGNWRLLNATLRFCSSKCRR